MALVRFWGVRGSIPTPGPSTVRYGGNTSCVELRIDRKLFIMDAGSGLRLLGNYLLKNTDKIEGHIFISHMHWDHIQGFPFFTPAFIPGNTFTIYGAEETDKSLSTIISEQMNPTYFPIQLEDMQAEIQFKRLVEGLYKVDDIEVETMYVNHPGPALGYKFNIDGKPVVYVSDNEPFRSSIIPEDASKDEMVIGEDGARKLIEFARGAALFIHDAQYTHHEYEKHVTWGHSPVDYTVDIAAKANVKRLILYHHDPTHNDETVDKMLSHARKIGNEKNEQMKIYAAYEGLELTL